MSRDSVKISGYDGVVCFVHTLPVICSTQSSSVCPSRFPSSLLPLSVLLSLVSFSFASLHPEVPFLIEQSSVGCFPFSPPPFSNISPSNGFSHSLYPSFSLSLSFSPPSCHLLTAQWLASTMPSLPTSFHLSLPPSLLALFVCMGCCAFKTAACDSGLISLICTNLVWQKQEAPQIDDILLLLQCYY